MMPFPTQCIKPFRGKNERLLVYREVYDASLLIMPKRATSPVSFTSNPSQSTHFQQ